MSEVFYHNNENSIRIWKVIKNKNVMMIIKNKNERIKLTYINVSKDEMKKRGMIFTGSKPISSFDVIVMLFEELS